MPTLIALALLLALCVAPAAQANPFEAPFDAETTLPPGFSETVHWSGLGNPTVIRFAPDGRVFVASKSGIINVFDGLEDPTPAAYADLRTQVHDYWDRGVLGMALDPAFTTGRPYIYVLYAYDKAPDSPQVPRWGDDCPTPPSPSEDGCTVTGRLSRLGADGGETVLIEDFCQQYPSHSLGSIEFGADGMLYVSSGDGASFDWTDYGQEGDPVNPCGDPPSRTLTPPESQGGALRSQAYRRPVGQPVSFDGSILRVDPDTGAAAAGNPANADPARRRIIAYGLRNPFRFAIRPGTSEVWLGDVGWDQIEEIDRVPDASRVRNYGWPCYEGPYRMSAYDALDLASCETLYAEGPGAVEQPYFHYFHWDRVVPGESCPTGTSSVSGLTFYTGDAFPAAYKDALFFSDYSRNCIWVVHKGADGLPDMSTRQTFAAGADGPAWLTTGPDGALYYADILGGTVRRIAADNGAPTARIGASPRSGPPPLEVSFDGTGSTDPDGHSLTYAWDLDGDGSYDDSTDPRPTFTYTSAGEVTARLRVTDPGGQNATATITITVGARPTVEIETSSTSWAVGDTITFSGRARDASGTPLPLTWALDMRHCWQNDPANCHTHEIRDYAGETGSFAAPDHEYPSHLLLSASAVDAGGIRTTETVRLDPRTVGLTLESSPPGLELSLGSETLPAPFTRTVIARSLNSIAAVSPQPWRDGVFSFAGWSDGLASAHTVTAPAAGAAGYTATFARPPRTSLAGAEAAGTGTATAAPASGSIYRMIAASDGTARSLRLLLDASSRASRLTLGIYSETAGEPGSLLGSGAVGAPAAGWNTAFLPDGVPLVAGRAYWLAILNPPGSGGELVWRDRAGGRELAQTTGALSALPATWVSAPGHWHADGHASGGAWADGPVVEPTPTPTATPTPVPDPPAPPSFRPDPPLVPPDPPRLVGAWGFDERAGATTADASGAGNPGTLNGPRRVAGRFGRGLSFDGRNDWVTVADSPSLDLTTGMTVEGWVRPTKGGAWRTLAIKETARGLAWALYPFGARGLPGGHADTGTELWAAGPSAPRPGRWTHLAVTYDGAAIRTYVDGRLAGTRAQSGRLQASAHPLRFGGNAVWPEWFAGRLDEIRVYDRALDGPQIQADMRRPVASGTRGDRRKPGAGARLDRYRGRRLHG